MLAVVIVSATSNGAEAGSAYEKWVWADEPELPVVPGEAAAASARSAGLDAGKLSQVASMRTRGRPYRLLAAADRASERVCFGLDAGVFASGFHCIGDPSVGDQAIVRFFAGGGSTPAAADHAALLGVVRDDVTEVVAVLENGARRSLGLNRWRAFAYSADAAEAFPTAVEAYSADGELLQRVELSGVDPPGEGG